MQAEQFWPGAESGMTVAQIRENFPTAQPEDQNEDDPDGRFFVVHSVLIAGEMADLTFHFHKNGLDGLVAKIGGLHVEHPLATLDAERASLRLKQRYHLTDCKRSDDLVETCHGTAGGAGVLLMTVEPTGSPGAVVILALFDTSLATPPFMLGGS